MKGRIAGIALLALSVSLMGCSARIGQSTSFDEAGRPNLVNGSPVTLTIEDDNKQGTANGPGPARYTSINPSGLQTFQSGSTPRDVYFEALADGTKRFVMSSGTDIKASAIKVDPESGVFEIGEFGTSGSEPIRAGNEAYILLADYWEARDQASKEAILAELKAYEAAGEAASGLIGLLIRSLAP